MVIAVDRPGQVDADTGAPAERRRRVPWLLVFSLGLEIAIFGPLLRPGTVWLLDSPSYLLGPHPHLPAASWSAEPWVVVRSPFEAMLAWLYSTLPWGQVRLLPLLAFVPIAVLGFRRLFDGERLPTICASLVYAVNPFVYERMLAGQEYFLIGVACLPLIASIPLRAREPVRAGVLGAALVLPLVALSPHLAFVAGVMLGCVVATSVAAGSRRIARSAAITLGLVVAACVVVALSAPSVAVDVSTNDLRAFRTTSDPRFGLLANVAGLYGFWRVGWPLAKDWLGLWPLFLASIVVVASIGIRRALATEMRPLVAGIAVAGAIGLVLALGDRGPTGTAFSWLYAHASWFRVMREPQKFLALLVLAYGVGFGAGVRALTRGMGSERSRRAAVALLVAVPCLYSFRSFWGFAGYVSPSPDPSSWSAADAAMGDGRGAVVVLPWHRYLPFEWTDGRVVATPLASAFGRPTLVAADPEVAGVRPLTADARVSAVTRLLRSTEGDDGRFAVRARALGVEYVVLVKTADWRVAGWLYEQPGVKLVDEWSDLALFRVDASAEARVWYPPPAADSRGDA